MINFSCPSCGKAFKLADDAAGRKAKRPCGESLTVPQLAAPVVAQAASAPPPPSTARPAPEAVGERATVRSARSGKMDLMRYAKPL